MFVQTNVVTVIERSIITTWNLEEPNPKFDNHLVDQSYSVHDFQQSDVLILFIMNCKRLFMTFS